MKKVSLFVIIMLSSLMCIAQDPQPLKTSINKEHKPPVGISKNDTVKEDEPTTIEPIENKKTDGLFVKGNIKGCKYGYFLLESSGYGYLGSNYLEIFYSSKTDQYGIEFKLGFMRLSAMVKYKRTVNGQYLYSGFSPKTGNEVVIVTEAQLSKFLSNYGGEDRENIGKDTRITVVYPNESYTIIPIRNK